MLPGVAVMKALAKRVAAMERPLPVGCATCRYWNWITVVTIEEDGTEMGRSRPDACPECGRVVSVGNSGSHKSRDEVDA